MAQSQTANFEYIARLKFASLVRYETDHEPDDVLVENYFKNSGQYLETGDTVDVVCRHDDGSWTRGTLEVLSKTHENLVVEQLTPWRTTGVQKARQMTKHYIPGNQTWMIKDTAGNVVAKGLNKAEACEMLGEPLEEDKAA